MFACQRCGFVYGRNYYVADQNLEDLRTCPDCADQYNLWRFVGPVTDDTSFVLDWASLDTPLQTPPVFVPTTFPNSPVGD